MKQLLFFAIITGYVSCYNSYSQTRFNNRYNYDKTAGIPVEGLSTITEVNNGFIGIGSYTQFGTDTSGLLVIKTDFNGNKEWIKSYDSEYYTDITSAAAVLTYLYDGGYALAGTRIDSTNSILLIKFNAVFDTLWTKTYKINQYFQRGDQVKQTPDSGFIIIASAAINATATGGQIALIKTDSSGNIEWQKMYGGSNYEYALTVDITSDSGFIIGGMTKSYGAGGYDNYIIKTDKNGNQQWQKTQGGIYDDCGARVIVAKDGGYIVCGCEGQYKQSGNTHSRSYMSKLDISGNIKWKKYYGPICDVCDLWNVKELSDSSIVAVGVTDDPYIDGMLIKTTATGDSLWYRTYRGTQGQDYLRDLVLTSDGGFILAGFVFPAPGEDSGNQDMWIVKTDSMGYSCPIAAFYYYDSPGLITFDFTDDTTFVDSVLWLFDDGNFSTELNPVHTYTSNGTYEVKLIVYHICGIDTARRFVSINDVGMDEINAENKKPEILIYPNPAKEILTIEFNGDGRMELYNLLGEKIAEYGLNKGTTSIAISQLANGFYLYKIKEKDNIITASGKIAIVK